MPSTATSRPALSSLLATTHAWREVIGGYSPSKSIFSISDPALIYTREDFNQIDYRLVHVMIDYNGAVWGSTLIDSLAYWNNAQLCLPRFSLNGEMPGVPVDYFLAFEVITHSTDIKVTLHRHNLAKTNSGIVYPRGGEDVDLYVPRAWLDQHLPKWELSYQLAQSLGLDGKALTKLIRDPAPALAPVSLDELEL